MHARTRTHAYPPPHFTHTLVTGLALRVFAAIQHSHDPLLPFALLFRTLKAPGTVLQPTVAVVSSTSSGGQRTVVLTRSLSLADYESAYFDFDVTQSQILYIAAVGNGTAFAYHKSHAVGTLSLLAVDGAATCVCASSPPPFGKTADGTLTYNAQGTNGECWSSLGRLLPDLHSWRACAVGHKPARRAHARTHARSHTRTLVDVGVMHGMQHRNFEQLNRWVWQELRTSVRPAHGVHGRVDAYRAAEPHVRRPSLPRGTWVLPPPLLPDGSESVAPYP